MNPTTLGRLARHGILGIGVATLAACTTLGAGSGQLSQPGAKTDAPVSFNWHAKGSSNSGTMQATLADGRAFSGPFVQLSSASRLDLDPAWPAWGRGWRRGYDGFGPDTAFETVYSGQVVANLQGPAAEHLRCRFALNDPASGMARGGQGVCQLSSGGRIDAVFPRA